MKDTPHTLADDEQAKLRLLFMFCAGVDGRDPAPFILEMDGRDCIRGHNVMKQLDDLLKAHWVALGAPSDEEIH